MLLYLHMSDNTAEGKWLPGFFPEIELPDFRFNHLLPSSADVQNERSCSSSPPIFLHGLDGENFTCTLLTYSFRL